jgi:hypothetical protein
MMVKDVLYLVRFPDGSISLAIEMFGSYRIIFIHRNHCFFNMTLCPAEQKEATYMPIELSEAIGIVANAPPENIRTTFEKVKKTRVRETRRCTEALKGQIMQLLSSYLAL